MIKKPSFFSRLKKALTRQKDTAVEISDEIIDSFEEQLKQTPNNFRLRLKLADAYLARGEREKALDEYCKSANLYLEHDFTQRELLRMRLQNPNRSWAWMPSGNPILRYLRVTQIALPKLKRHL